MDTVTLRGTRNLFLYRIRRLLQFIAHAGKKRNQSQSAHKAFKKTHDLRAKQVQLRSSSSNLKVDRPTLVRATQTQHKTQARGGSVTEPDGVVLDTHRLRRDFHQELGPWGSNQHHYKLQLINVYHTHMKENRRDGGCWRRREGWEVQQSELVSGEKKKKQAQV